jgi:sulfur-carrier protein adenylyltransferase/sulfurtransferase
MTIATVTSSPRREHVIPSRLLEEKVRVTVVGCGGTGSAIAAGLPYLHQAMLAHGHPHGLDVTFVDGDRISRANCVRQPFSISEIGLYKATVLATRINLFWGLGWESSPHFLDEGWRGATDIVIGCVDSRKSRKVLMSSHAFWNSYYWLDIGNNAESGQFVLGQPPNNKVTGEDQRLPTVADLFPEIVDPKLDKKDKLPSCSAVEALQRQEPFVNQTLAYQALAMLARLFRRGRISYHGGFINIATGRTSSLPVDPAVWQRIVTSFRRK